MTRWDQACAKLLEQREKLVLVVGAGVSIQATAGNPLASWKGLLSNGLERVAQVCREVDGSWLSRRQADLDSTSVDDVLHVAHYVQTRLEKRGEFAPWMEETVGSLKIVDPSLIRLLAGLNTAIITTNYDSLIEAESHRETILPKQTNLVESALQGGKGQQYVIHLHGCWTHKDSIVLSLDSYYDVLRQEHIQNELRAAYTYNTFLFVGCGAGLADPNFDAFFRWARKIFADSSRRHFRLVSTAEMQNAESQYLGAKIELIPYGDHHNLYPFLAELLGSNNASGSCSAANTKMTAPESEVSLAEYLNSFIKDNSFLEVRGLQHDIALSVPLEKVYVALKLDTTHPYDRARFIRIVDQRLQRALNMGELLPSELMAAVRRVLRPKETPEPFILTFADLHFVIWSGALSEKDSSRIEELLDSFIQQANRDLEQWVRSKARGGDTLSLAEAYHDHRHLVVLGDPGSGKTTLTRWLGLKMAIALQKRQTELVAKRNEVDPEANDDSPVQFGQTRLPLLVPIWQYVRHLRSLDAAQEWNTEKRSFRHFLIHRESKCSSLVQSFLDSGRCLILIDGLDEIPKMAERDEVVRAVNDFFPPVQAGFGQMIQEDVEAGNRLIITSRIAGNYASKLSGELPRLTIQPMSGKAIEHFVPAWMEAVTSREPSAGTEPQERVQARAAKLAEQLLQIVRKTPPIAGLVTNPQLASVVCALFYRGKGHLPERRVDLYQRAIENFVEAWELRPAREGGLTRNEIFSILEPIAEHMQATSAPIREAVLRNLTIRHLALARAENPDRPSPALLDTVSRLVAVLRKDVGLLSAFGEDEYRFLHRSFQEYLAARHLVRDLEQAARRLVEKMHDPLWREPILLALGYLSNARPLEIGTIVQQVLADSGRFDEFVSKSALFMVDALPEMDLEGVVNASAVIGELLNKLFGAYADRGGLSRFDKLRELVARAIGKIWAAGFERALEQTLVSALGDETRCAAAAALALQLKFFTARIVNALLDAQAFDSGEWGWPVDTALRTAVAEHGGEAAAVPLTQKLNFRFELSFDSEAVQALLASPEWLRVVLAVYGGYRNYDTDKSLREYYQIATYLQLPEGERRPFESFFALRWGREDPIYQMAVYLDTYQPKKSWEIVPQFEIAHLYRDSLLTPWILDQLRNGPESPIGIEELLARPLEMRDPTLELVDRFIAAIALGDKAALELRGAADEHGPDLLTNLVLKRADQIASALRDPVARAARALPDELKLLGRRVASNGISIERAIELITAILETVISYGAFPIDTLAILDDFPQALHPQLLAEYLAYSLAGCGDDTVYNAALAADLLDKRSGRPELLVRAILSTAHARQSRWSVCSFGWPLERVPSQNFDSDDIPVEVFTAIETIHSQISFMRLWAFQNLAPLIKRNPDLLPEALAVCLGDMGDRSERGETFRILKPDMDCLADPREAILEQALSLRSSYHRARALCRLAKYFPRRKAEICREVAAAIPEIENPQHRVSVWERVLAEELVEFTDDPRQSGQQAVLRNVAEEIERITDPDERARAFARLCLYSSHERRVSLLRQALEALGEQPDLRSVRTLTALRSRIRVFPELKNDVEFLIARVPEELKARANEQHGELLAAAHPLLASLSDGSPHLWAPIVLAALLRDLRKRFGRIDDPDELWAALVSSPDSAAVEALIEYSQAGRLVFTATAALALDRLSSDGDSELVCAVLPYVVRPEPDTRPILRQWLRNSKRQLAEYAALLLAESQGLSMETVPGVFSLMRSRNDIVKHRAARLIHHPAIVPEEKPTRLISIFGQDTVETLVRLVDQHRSEPHTRLRIHWMFHDLVHDNPKALAQWCGQIATGGPPGRFAKEIVSSVESISPEVWDEILAQLKRGGPPRVTEVLLQSICRLVYRSQRITDFQWEEFVAVIPLLDLKSLNTRLFLQVSTKEFAQALAWLFRTSHAETPAAWFETAYAYIQEKLSCSFCDVLSVEGSEGIQAAMREIAFQQMYVQNENLWERMAEAAEPFKAEPALLRPLVACLSGALSKSVLDEGFYWIRERLLTLTAAVAREVPLTFADLIESEHEIDRNLLETLLIGAARHHNSYTGRASAIRLLGCMRRVSLPVIEVLQSCMQDVEFVKDAVLDSLPDFRRLESISLIRHLLRGLHDESALACYATAQLLSKIALFEDTTPSARQEILDGLAEAIRDPKSRRYVYFYYVDGVVPNMPRLDQVFVEAMMLVTAL